MELFWLIVQAIVLCTALLAVTCGLMWAPWYVLLALLGLVLVSIQHLMPDPKSTSSPERTVAPFPAAIAQSQLSGEPHDSPREVSPHTAHSTHLIYRGIDYVLSQEHEGHPV